MDAPARQILPRFDLGKRSLQNQRNTAADPPKLKNAAAFSQSIIRSSVDIWKAGLDPKIGLTPVPNHSTARAPIPLRSSRVDSHRFWSLSPSILHFLFGKRQPKIKPLNRQTHGLRKIYFHHELTHLPAAPNAKKAVPGTNRSNNGIRARPSRLSRTFLSRTYRSLHWHIPIATTQPLKRKASPKKSP